MSFQDRRRLAARNAARSDAYAHMIDIDENEDVSSYSLLARTALHEGTPFDRVTSQLNTQ